MTYKSRGRSIVEVVVAVTFVGFLTGFVAVLCIGNYFRAKRAQHRQKQRRLARLAGVGGSDGNVDSPAESPSSRSHYSGSSSFYDENEQQHLLGGKRRQQVVQREQKQHLPPRDLLDDAVYVDVPTSRSGNFYRTQQLNPQRRRPDERLSDDYEGSQPASSDVMSI